jgi:sodium/glucose cotransporter 1
MFQGAFWSLMIGLVVGMVRFIWEATYPNSPCGETAAKHFLIGKVHYLHFGCILFFIVFVAAIVISLKTPPIDPKHVSQGLTLTFKPLVCRASIR